MIEIVCPSCDARYQVPDDSIGPEGRKVTCSNCSHKWRAYREDAGAEIPGAPGAAVGEAPRAESTAEPAEAGAEQAAPGAPAEASAGTPSQDGSREQQMDAIRRMLDDLKRSSEDEPDPVPAAAPKPERSGTSRRREEEYLEDDLDADPLKSRIAQLDKSGRGGKEAERTVNYDAAKLRRMHEKRARRLQKAKERKRKSGAFLTGFTLVAVVSASMVGLYVLKPQIVAGSPEMAPAMNEYVTTVDRYRLALDEATADWRAWAAAQFGKLTGSEQGNGSGQAQNAQQGSEPAAATQ